MTESKAKIKRGQIVKDTVFLDAEWTSKTIAEIAGKINLSTNSISTRLSNYRKRGISVPKFKRGNNNHLKVDELNKYVNEKYSDISSD